MPSRLRGEGVVKENLVLHIFEKKIREITVNSSQFISDFLVLVFRVLHVFLVFLGFIRFFVFFREIRGNTRNLWNPINLKNMRNPWTKKSKKPTRKTQNLREADNFKKIQRNLKTWNLKLVVKCWKLSRNDKICWNCSKNVKMLKVEQMLTCVDICQNINICWRLVDM